MKNLLAIGTLTALAVLVGPDLAQAQGLPGINQDPGKMDLGNIVTVLVGIIKFGFAFAAAIGALFIVVSGYQYIFSAGNPEKVEKAKQGLTWAIVGFILAISSYALVLLLQQVLGSKQKISQVPGLNLEGPGQASTVLERLIEIGLLFGGAAAVLFLVLGGYRYVTSQGNRDLAEGAKNTITYAVIGLILVMLAAVIFETTRKAIF